MTVNPHAASVDAWLERSATELSRPNVLRLFEAALDALWKQAATTLGEVTLAAIAARVLHTASEKFPLLASLRVEAGAGFQCGELSKRVGSVQASELIEAFRFVLVEFLTVLGRLTAEILTSDLHTELSQVAFPHPGRVKQGGAAPPSPRRPKDHTR